MVTAAMVAWTREHGYLFEIIIQQLLKTISAGTPVKTQNTKLKHLFVQEAHKKNNNLAWA